MNTGSAMRCVETHLYEDSWGSKRKAAEMWGTWRHTRLSRQEGGLIQDIKGGVESQPSVNHTGDQEVLLCIALVLNWPQPSFNHGTSQGKLVLGQMYHVTSCFLQMWSNQRKTLVVFLRRGITFTYPQFTYSGLFLTLVTLLPLSLNSPVRMTSNNLLFRLQHLGKLQRSYVVDQYSVISDKGL